jgi:amino acid transporter
MMKRIKQYWPELSGGALGAFVGWMYWYHVGCSSGACMIQTSPYLSTLYGALLGASGLSLVVDLIKKRKTQSNG